MSMKVSVCIPIYGVEKYIERCARSLFEQTMQEGIEFIFVNDCSPDKSIDVLEDVLKDYPHRKSQVRIVHHEKNQGRVAARTTALKYASGEYIIHCDSDDWVDLDYYETLYTVAISKNADVVYTPYITHFGQKQMKSSLPSCETAQELLQAVLENRFQWSLINKLVRAKYALNAQIYCPSHICYSEDLLWTSQMLALCQHVAFVDSTYYHYFKGNPNAGTKNFSRASLDNYLEAVEILKKKLDGTYNLNTAYVFALFLGVIYKLFKGKEFSCYAKDMSLSTILKSRESIAIKAVVCIAKISYCATASVCYFLLQVRKLIRNQKLKRIKS